MPNIGPFNFRCPPYNRPSVHLSPYLSCHLTSCQLTSRISICLALIPCPCLSIILPYGHFSDSLSVCLSAYLSVHLSVCLSGWLSACLSVCHLVRLFYTNCISRASGRSCTRQQEGDKITVRTWGRSRSIRDQ